MGDRFAGAGIWGEDTSKAQLDQLCLPHTPHLTNAGTRGAHSADALQARKAGQIEDLELKIVEGVLRARGAGIETTTRLWRGASLLLGPRGALVPCAAGGGQQDDRVCGEDGEVLCSPPPTPTSLPMMPPSPPGRFGQDGEDAAPPPAVKKLLKVLTLAAVASKLIAAVVDRAPPAPPFHHPAA